MPRKNVAYTFNVSLLDYDDSRVFKEDPTLVDGDVKISKDAGALQNLTTLPTVVGSSAVVTVSLSADEMDADHIAVLFSDQAGDEWQDLMIAINTDTCEVWSCTTRELTAFGVGAIEYTYTVTNSVTGLPVQGVKVWITTDSAGSNTVWSGSTDTLGVARDANNNKPFLDAGTYYFWKSKPGFVDDQNPDTEVVS